MNTKFMSVSMSLLIAGFTLCSCDKIISNDDNPTTPSTPSTPTPTVTKSLSEINSVDDEGGKEVVAFTYGDDGKVTKAVNTYKDSEGKTS